MDYFELLDVLLISTHQQALLFQTAESQPLMSFQTDNQSINGLRLLES
jgi:hypothetical protein